MLRLFQDNFIFGEATFSHFFRVTTATQQLHFRNKYFSEQLFFLLFQNKDSTEQPFFENKKFFMAVTFWNSCFSLFRIKIYKKELLF